MKLSDLEYAARVAQFRMEEAIALGNMRAYPNRPAVMVSVDGAAEFPADGRLVEALARHHEKQIALLTQSLESLGVDVDVPVRTA